MVIDALAGISRLSGISRGHAEKSQGGLTLTRWFDEARIPTTGNLPTGHQELPLCCIDPSGGSIPTLIPERYHILVLMPEDCGEDCPCLNLTCSRYGDCASCREFQHSRGKIPYCEREETPGADIPEESETGTAPGTGKKIGF
jgi:hypothetical protein